MVDHEKERKSTWKGLGCRTKSWHRSWNNKDKSVICSSCKYFYVMLYDLENDQFAPAKGHKIWQDLVK